MQCFVTVLIAGVGYIGAPLALEYLARGEAVVGLENFFCTSPRSIASLGKHPDVHLIRGSISSSTTLDRVFDLGPFRTIHLLAAQPSSSARAASASYTERTNLVGARMLLDRACESGSPRVVFASSFHVYGTPLHGCIDESHSIGSFSDLSHLSKIYVEKLLEMYSRSGRLSGVSVRLGIVYGLGPVMKSNPLFLTVPNLFARQAAREETLRVNPEASAPVGFIHLQDAVSALLSAETLEGPYANANAAAQALTVAEVALAVRETAERQGLKLTIAPEQKRAAVPDTRFTVSSRLEQAGWNPVVRLHDRIGEVIEYARSGKWTDA